MFWNKLKERVTALEFQGKIREKANLDFRELIGKHEEKARSNFYILSELYGKLVSKSENITPKGLVECETCGCLLNKETAVRGRSVIVIRTKPNTDPLHTKRVEYDEIKEIYYCKIQNPKPKNLRRKGLLYDDIRDI